MAEVSKTEVLCANDVAGEIHGGVASCTLPFPDGRTLRTILIPIALFQRKNFSCVEIHIPFFLFKYKLNLSFLCV